MNNSDIDFFLGHIPWFMDIDLMFTLFILDDTVSHASGAYKTLTFQTYL